MIKALLLTDAFSRGNAKISTYTEEAESDFYQMNLEFKRQSLKYMVSLKNINESNKYGIRHFIINNVWSV